MAGKAHRNALPLGYELHWYRIERVLGQGGFGLTYLAQDINLDRLVAIKEYMPAQMSMRESDHCIHPLSSEVDEDFRWGLKRFISEARTLTQFEHPNLVRVINIFEANNSAYMVMSYVVGNSLRQLLRNNHKLSEAELVNLVFPLMDALETVHRAGFVHRDIKPSNVYIREDGRPVLLDFGSARQTRGNFETRTLTNFVSPGYAPIEQYSSKSNRQGPWTDIYGLGATVYEVMTGEMPEAAIDRGVLMTGESGDNLISVSQRCKGQYSDKFLAAIDHALAFNVEGRPQSIAEWRGEFGIDESQIEGMTVPLAEAATLPARAIRDTQTAATEKLERPTQAHARVNDRNDDVSVTEPTQVAIRQGQASGHAPPRFAKPSWVTVIGLVIIVVLAGFGGSRYWPEMRQQLSGLAFIQEWLAGDAGVPPEQAETAPAGNATGTTGPEPPPLQESSVTAKRREPISRPSPAPTRQEKVDALLRLASEDMDALRLTTPASSNAYDKYQQVLELDEENVRALRGLDTISDKYLQFFYTNLESDNLTRARQHLDKAWEVTPGAPKVLVARKSLLAAEEEAREEQRPPGLLDRVRGLFD